MVVVLLCFLRFIPSTLSSGNSLLIFLSFRWMCVNSCFRVNAQYFFIFVIVIQVSFYILSYQINRYCSSLWYVSIHFIKYVFIVYFNARYRSVIRQNLYAAFILMHEVGVQILNLSSSDIYLYVCTLLFTYIYFDTWIKEIFLNTRIEENKNRTKIGTRINLIFTQNLKLEEHVGKK